MTHHKIVDDLDSRNTSRTVYTSKLKDWVNIRNVRFQVSAAGLGSTTTGRDTGCMYRDSTKCHTGLVLEPLPRPPTNH